MASERILAVALLGLVSQPAWGFDPADYYTATCAACHGHRGTGDGPAGAALPVKPANFTDPAFWSSRDDATVAKAIRDGGPAVGKSPLMAGFGGTLSVGELDALVAWLHGLERKPAAAPRPSAAASAPKSAPRKAPEAPPAEPEEPSAGAEDATEGDTSAEIAAPPAGPERTDGNAEAEPEIVEAIQAVGPTVAGARPEPDPKTGQRLFRQGCATCHGIKGDGRGPAARFMHPKPRDLTAGQFRFRSTAYGEPPLPEDLYRTIERGLRGTPMPGFAGLEPDELWQLVFHVQSLSGVDASSGEALAVPPMPAKSPAQIARGAEAYATYGCAACHGDGGRGDGAAGAALVDASGNDLTPADLTKPWTFKRGADPIDLFRTISTGLDGTPMAGFESMPAEDRWALVHWIMQ